MKPTIQQQAIYEELRSGHGHLMVRARAGTGKTTICIGGIQVVLEAHPRYEITVAAYNKAIAEEIKKKLIALGHTDYRKVNASTMHGLGFGPVRFVFKPTLDDRKVRKLIANHCDEDPAYDEFAVEIEKLVRVGKQAAVGYFEDEPAEDPETWFKLADHFDIDTLGEPADMDFVVWAAQKIYQESLRQTDIIDFDDMILFPLIKKLEVKFKKDLVFVDEAQDLSRARQALIRKFVKPRGRLVFVGDERQAIYGFAGADSEALARLQKALKPKVLPLSVTWRCPKSVVELAQTIVPDIQAAPRAAAGVVDGINKLPDDLSPADAILCRNTAPLVTEAYNLIRAGTACKVEGRDIGEGIKKLFERWKVKQLDAFENRLVNYRANEIRKALEKDREDKAQSIEDKCDTALAIVEECRKQKLHMVADAVRFVDNLFGDDLQDKQVLTLATYHRSKGREWKRVILYEHARRCPSKWARQEWQIEQEHNLAYVAFTRAMQELLFYDTGSGFDEPKPEAKEKATVEAAAAPN